MTLSAQLLALLRTPATDAGPRLGARLDLAEVTETVFPGNIRKTAGRRPA
jgi:hypothetical protein